MAEILKKHQLNSGQNLSICKGDLTREQTDIIVNVANSQLAHDGGVAAAIARIGGEAIQRESQEWVRIHGLATHTRPAVTSGGNLACSSVIHAIGPISGQGDEDRKLSNVIQASLKTTETLKASSIAFPAISTGIFGFPKDRASEIFMRTIQQYFQEYPQSDIKDTRIILLDDETLGFFLKAFEKAFGDGNPQ